MPGFNIAAPNLVSVCFDSRKFEGKIYHKWSREPMLFASEIEMIDRIDGLCDKIAYPRRAVATRKFGKKLDPIVRNERKGECVMTYQEIQEKTGDKGTFMIHVQYRQNATWQGQITWVEKKQTQSFRSALELIKLIDGALDETEKPAEEQR